MVMYCDGRAGQWGFDYVTARREGRDGWGRRRDGPMQGAWQAWAGGVTGLGTWRDESEQRREGSEQGRDGPRQGA